MMFNPGAIVGLALVCGFGVVPVLVLLSHDVLRIESAKPRFLAAVAVCCLLWAVGTGWLMWVSDQSWFDVLAGAAILVTATVAWGILWSLVCWGFTTSLLAALCGLGGPASRQAWFRAYGGGSSIENFADNRLSILLALGLARVDGHGDSASIALTGTAGRFMAALVSGLRRFYGVSDTASKGASHE